MLLDSPEPLEVTAWSRRSKTDPGRWYGRVLYLQVEGLLRVIGSTDSGERSLAEILHHERRAW